MKLNYLRYIGLLACLLFSCNAQTDTTKSKKQASSETTEEVRESTMPDSSYIKASDVLWASPKGFNLTMDIYTPTTKKASYPVIVMYHGGGWLINNKSIMDEAAAYLATEGEYVVCNVNYRLLGDMDNTTTMNEIIEDAFGGLLWVKENINNYDGNPEQVAVTGDSAGGHLATMVAMQGNQLSVDRFLGETLGFMPTYLPKGETVETVSQKDMMNVQAAIISYGVFDIYGKSQGAFETKQYGFWQMAGAEPRGIFGEGISTESHPEWYKKVSPMYTIPQASAQSLPPMLFTVGSEDTSTSPASIQAFTEKLKEAGHDNVAYWVHEGRPHAFLDSGTNEFLNISFNQDAPPALDKMLAFLDSIFYK